MHAFKSQKQWASKGGPCTQAPFARQQRHSAQWGSRVWHARTCRHHTQEEGGTRLRTPTTCRLCIGGGGRSCCAIIGPAAARLVQTVGCQTGVRASIAGADSCPAPARGHGRVACLCHLPPPLDLMGGRQELCKRLLVGGWQRSPVSPVLRAIGGMQGRREVRRIASKSSAVSLVDSCADLMATGWQRLRSGERGVLAARNCIVRERF